jgi:hypothetical protein
MYIEGVGVWIGGGFEESLIYIYIYICMMFISYIYVFVYIHIYIWLREVGSKGGGVEVQGVHFGWPFFLKLSAE